MKYAGETSASTAATASRRVDPSGSRPSVSTVNEMTAGMPTDVGSPGHTARLVGVGHGQRLDLVDAGRANDAT